MNTLDPNDARYAAFTPRAPLRPSSSSVVEKAQPTLFHGRHLVPILHLTLYGWLTARKHSVYSANWVLTKSFDHPKILQRPVNMLFDRLQSPRSFCDNAFEQYRGAYGFLLPVQS